MALFQLGMRRVVALPLSQSQSSSSFFVCRKCLLHQRQQPRLLSSSSSSSLASKILRLVKGKGPARRSYATAESQSQSQSPMGSLGSRIGASAAEAAGAGAGAGAGKGAGKKSWWPEVNCPVVGYWLIGSAVSVYGLVVWGGLTRLTESGLSITEWRPVTGSLPPTTVEQWESEFEKYRASPEYHILNPHMDLDEFKKIYFMEWTHRLWGRLVGLTFALPTVYFIAARRVTPRMAASLVGITCLIGFQGFIGWWMVKSGLKDDLFAPGSHPRVSQYRLATHLATAFFCYSWMLLAGLSIFRARRLLADPAAATKHFAALQSPALRPLRASVAGLIALVGVTVVSGALVAGLDAGLIYNEFPYMGKGFAPPASELWDRFYCRRDDGADLWWRNALENPSLVQLNHRILAVTSATAVLALWAASRRGHLRAAVPKDVARGITGLVHLVSFQVTLGLCTLLYMVPISLAAMHQAGALALLTGAIVVAQRLHVPPSTLALVRKRVAAAAKVAK